MEKFCIECMEKKKKEQIQGIKYSRRLVLYHTIQLVIVNMQIKYEVSILYHCSAGHSQNLRGGPKATQPNILVAQNG